MSLVLAQREAARLKAVMERHGVRCSIELQAGRPWSGDPYYSRKYLIMNHHTAGSRTGNTPSLALCKRGRSNLPGPLCNGYGGRDLVYRIITMGLANHPGLGGPLTVAGFTVPKDSARISAWGTEWEHTGVDPWPSPMQQFMGRANAALCEFWAISVGRSIEHSTWARGRKIDRNGYDAPKGQAEIRAHGAPVTKAPAKVPPKPKPPALGKPAPIAVDGDWGPATWRRTQMLVRVAQTGKTNLATRKAVQKHLSVRQDGDWGPITIKAMQRRTGARADGDMGPITIRAWQRYLNNTLS